MKHVIFFDGSCPLCHQAVAWILRRDSKGVFFFAPLEGKQAKAFFVGKYAYLKRENTLVLVEGKHERVSIRSQAVFRILWLLGGKWKWVGWLYGFPLLDLFYRLVAAHRKRGKREKVPSLFFSYPDRFEPGWLSKKR